jgi:MraZ protein
MMGFEKCLSLFPESNFEKLVSTIDGHDFNQRDARDYIRMALSSAIELEIDDHGRVQLSVDTMKDYKLNKNVRVIGVNDHLEIWPEEAWLQYQKEQRDQFEIKAEKLSKGQHE